MGSISSSTGGAIVRAALSANQKRSWRDPMKRIGVVFRTCQTWSCEVFALDLVTLTRKEIDWETTELATDLIGPPGTGACRVTAFAIELFDCQIPEAVPSGRFAWHPVRL